MLPEGYFDVLGEDDIRIKGSRIGIESELHEYVLHQWDIDNPVAELIIERRPGDKHQVVHDIADGSCPPQHKDTRHMATSSEMIGEVTRHRPAIIGHQERADLLAPAQQLSVRRPFCPHAGIAHQPDGQSRVPPAQLDDEGARQMFVKQVSERHQPDCAAAACCALSCFRFSTTGGGLRSYSASARRQYVSQSARYALTASLLCR